MKPREMQVGRVTLVLAETSISGKRRAEFAASRIARHLRDDTCGGNAEAEAISVDDRGLRQREWKYLQTSIRNVLRRHRLPATRWRIAWCDARRC